MPLTLLLYGGITLLLLFIWCLIEKNKRPKGFPAGPISWPIVGNLHQIGLEPYKSFVEMGKKYGKIFSVDYGSYRSIVVNDLHLMKKCLNDSAFAGRPKFRIFLERTAPGSSYARGIVTSELERWSEHRRFVIKNLKEFGFGKRSMEGIIREEINYFIERLREKISEPIKTRGLFNAAVMNSLWGICVGVHLPQDDPQLQKLHNGIIDAFSAANPLCLLFPIITKLFPKLSGYEMMLAGNRDLCQVVTDEYHAHKVTLTPGEPRDLLDAMIEEVEATTDPLSSFYKKEGEASVVKSIEDLFLGGSETTSTTLIWFTLFMILYPDIQEKLYTEIDHIVGPSRMPELADRPNMPYTECVLIELLRFSSVFPLFMHSVIKNVNIEGYFIPKETVFTPNFYAVHHSPEIWGDPENFRPERFLLPDGTANTRHEAFLAFSFGKRNCIGERLARDQLFLFTTSLIQQFRFETNPNSPKPSLKPTISVVLSPSPFDFIIHERLER